MTEPALFSPLRYLPRLSSRLRVNLYAKRDDLLPFGGGGNKVRKVRRILDEIEPQGYDALVTTGGLQSNHARVVALFAAQKGWHCRLILHGDPSFHPIATGNLLLMQLANAEIEVVSPDAIAAHIEKAMTELAEAGYHPYEIPGGAHSVIGALAYVDGASELQSQWPLKRLGSPDYLILASGTGTTQAGLIVGLDRLGWNTSIIGISVARRNPRGRAITTGSCNELARFLGHQQPSYVVDFRDEWVGAGYEKADESTLNAVRIAAKQEGLILDPTYTGKAFAALLELIARGEIAKGANVVFWHTGGIMNLLASDYFRQSIP